MIWLAYHHEEALIAYLVSLVATKHETEMPNPTCSTDKSVNQIQILQAQVPIYATDQAKTETVVKSRKLPPKKRHNKGTERMLQVSVYID